MLDEQIAKSILPHPENMAHLKLPRQYHGLNPFLHAFDEHHHLKSKAELELIMFLRTHDQINLKFRFQFPC